LTVGDLGEDFGATLTEVEVQWLMDHEFAREAADVAWRRTKLGLRLSRAQLDRLEQFMSKQVEEAFSPAAQ
jgi:glycerol-3-phosphate dehydrogenase